MKYRVFRSILSHTVHGMIIFFILSSTVRGQVKSVKEGELRIPAGDIIQVLTIKDGSTLIGRIIDIGTEEITFESELGEMVIPISKIEKVIEAPTYSIKGGKYWFENPNATRLYFAPTGRMLKKDQGYFSDYYLFFPGIAFGITDNITIGGGMSLIPGVAPENQVFYFTPKIGIKASKNSNFAIGALIIELPEENPTVGVLFGVGTFGDLDGSLTTGLGYGFVDDEIAEKPMFMIGGEKRLSRRISFVSENWIFPGVDDALISYGLRFFDEGISVDLALFNVTGENLLFPGFPWVDFVFNF